MEITGLGITFLGVVILAINAYANSMVVWGTMADRLQKPIVVLVGLVLIAVGFGLQFVAALLALT